MSTIKSRQISELINFSNSMLENAEAGEWEKVIRSESRRAHMINTFFSTPSSVEHIPDVINATREMLSINEKLKKLAVSERDTVKNKAGSIGHGRRATSAYAENIA